MNWTNIIKYRKLTKKKFCEETGISKSALHNYETGKNQPTLDVLIKASKILNCSLETLAGLDDNNIIDKKMLSDEKRKLVDEILNLETKDVSSVLAFIKLINEQKQ